MEVKKYFSQLIFIIEYETNKELLDNEVYDNKDIEELSSILENSQT